MSNTDRDLIAELAAELTGQSYSPVVVRNYCAYAREFLAYLAQHEIPITAVTPSQIAEYLRQARKAFGKRRGRQPARDWHSIPRSGIHALLRFARGQWPPEPDVVGPEATLRHEICLKYEIWLRDERGLASASIVALLAEARHFLVWQLDRGGAHSLKGLSVRDIDLYMDARAPGQRRVSLKDYAERLRSLLRYMHRTRYIASDLAAHVVSPMLYAYEGVPSILEPDQITAVLESTKRDRSPMGLRDYAMLLLLATYGLRSGEVRNLRLEDIDWRSESLRVRHSKTGACSHLPLLPHVGEALLTYLRHGRPKTNRREVFIRSRAPYHPLRSYASEVRRRLHAAGVKPPGKCGPHIFRHARAVEMLRASVPQKIIGDVLGHRSTEATIPYLKLAIEDLRAIALDVPDARFQRDVPGSEVLA